MSSRAAGAARPERETRSFERSPAFLWLVRAGFVARGVTYGVIGGLALAIATGSGTAGTSPNQQGALDLIARSVIGKAALVVICAGLLAYAVWKMTQGAFGYGPEGGGGAGLMDRVSNVCGGLVYLGFLAVAIRALAGSSGNSSAAPKHAAAGVLGWPGGQAMVGLAGAILIAISLYQAYDGLSGRFARQSKPRQMSRQVRQVFMALGRAGLTARAIVFALIGYFLVRTAIDFNPNAAVGVDGALARLHNRTFGPWLLALAATGLEIFAAFSLLEARFRRL